MLEGFANLEGTRGYFNKKSHMKNFVFENDRFAYSKLGLGTFIGDFSKEDSRLFRESITYALLNGINFIDTSINYRGMKSERDLGIALKKLIEEGKIKRDEVIISSKAGIIPGDAEIMLRPINYMKERLIDTGILKEDEVYMEETLWLTMSPKYFQYALEISRNHLNLETIDIYYIHEIELSMKHFGADKFYENLRDIIQCYENMVDEGKIREYGMATWEAFQLNEGEAQFISLEKVMKVVKEVRKDHHFKHLMVPINLRDKRCDENKSQSYKGEMLTIFECAKKYGIDVHASGPLGQGEATDYSTIKEYLHYLNKESNCESYFIGTKQREHLKENIEIMKEIL